jgi:hypothetical protein
MKKYVACGILVGLLLVSAAFLLRLNEECDYEEGMEDCCGY